MSDIPVWKKVLGEPNAMGWIGLMIVVVAIGFGTLYFGHGRHGAPRAQGAQGTQGAYASAGSHLAHGTRSPSEGK
jgi:hypothetical protein